MWTHYDCMPLYIVVAKVSFSPCNLIIGGFVGNVTRCGCPPHSHLVSPVSPDLQSVIIHNEGKYQ